MLPILTPKKRSRLRTTISPPHLLSSTDRFGAGKVIVPPRMNHESLTRCARTETRDSHCALRLAASLRRAKVGERVRRLERVMNLEASRRTLRRFTLARSCRELPAAYATSIAAPRGRYGMAEGERESTIRRARI